MKGGGHGLPWNGSLVLYQYQCRHTFEDEETIDLTKQHLKECTRSEASTEDSRSVTKLAPIKSMLTSTNQTNAQEIGMRKDIHGK
jgi:hypothetical protein